MVAPQPVAVPVPGPLPGTCSGEPSRCHSMSGWGSAPSGHSRRSCPPATAVMTGISLALGMLAGAVGEGLGGVRVCHVGHPHTCPTLQDHHRAPDPSFRAHSNSKGGCRDALALGPPKLGASCSPSSLHCWGHTTLGADVEAPAVLPCRAGGQAGVQASISHLQSQERQKLRHKKKTKVGRKKKRSSYLSALNVEGALVPQDERGPCQQPSVLLPGDRGRGDTRHHTGQLQRGAHSDGYLSGMGRSLHTGWLCQAHGEAGGLSPSLLPKHRLSCPSQIPGG